MKVGAPIFGEPNPTIVDLEAANREALAAEIASNIHGVDEVWMGDYAEKNVSGVLEGAGRSKSVDVVAVKGDKYILIDAAGGADVSKKVTQQFPTVMGQLGEKNISRLMLVVPEAITEPGYYVEKGQLWWHGKVNDVEQVIQQKVAGKPVEVIITKQR
jgi:hypothetical protein